MPLEYEQHLSAELSRLFFDDRRYKGLRELIQNDDSLVFAVRKDEIHLYYLGGRILKITRARNKLRFAFDQKYARKQRGSDELIKNDALDKMLKDPFDIDLWLRHFDVLKQCMEHFRANISQNEERQLQQEIELANRDLNSEVLVIDNEYGVRKECRKESKLCKFDLIALYRDSYQYKICLIELKCGDGALGGNAGIDKHIRDFSEILRYRKADIVHSVNNLIEYKRKVGYLSNVPKDLRIDENTDICVSVLCYDLDKAGVEYAQRMREQGCKLIGEQGNVHFELHFNVFLEKRKDIVLTRQALLAD